MNRILDVAAQLLVEGGWDAFTIAEISARAQVSVGVVYQRFTDKEGLFAALHTAHLARFAALVHEAYDTTDWWQELAPADAVRETVTRLGQIWAEVGDLNGVLILNSHKARRLAQDGANTMITLRDTVIDVLHQQTHADAVTLDVCYRIAFASFMDYATFHHLPGQKPTITWDQLIGGVAHACSCYITGSGPSITA